ncbi:DBIRD complex subunit ZNF326-like [Lissotriton helveticus]
MAMDTGLRLLVPFCKFRTFEEKDIEAHLESTAHQETFDHIQNQTKFDKVVMSFLHAYKKQIKRESVLTATSIQHNPIVKSRYEQYAKGENPFEIFEQTGESVVEETTDANDEDNEQNEEEDIDGENDKNEEQIMWSQKMRMRMMLLTQMITLGT